MTKYLVIFDTVAIVQSVINPKGAAGKCLAYFHAGEISVAVSRATLKEVKDVLSRPALRDRFQQIASDVGRFPHTQGRYAVEVAIVSNDVGECQTMTAGKVD